MKHKLGSSLTNPTINIPGPGRYDASLKTKKESPTFGFGSSTTEHGPAKTFPVPGPGLSPVKSYIRHVPDYPIPRRTHTPQ